MAVVVMLSANVLSRCGRQSGVDFGCSDGRFVESSSLANVSRVQLRKPTVASMQNGDRRALQVETLSDSAQLEDVQASLTSPPVFEDVAQGICCYRTPSGEVTCEGFDEGPHFHPAARCQQRTVLKNAQKMSFVINSRGPTACSSAESSFYKCVTEEERGEIWYEGKDES